MEKEFEPFHEKASQNEFCPWDLKAPVSESPPSPVDTQAIFEAECQRLREEARLAGYKEGMANALSEIESLKSRLLEWIDFFKTLSVCWTRKSVTKLSKPFSGFVNPASDLS